MNIKNIKVGDKVRVISQGWDKPSLVGRIGLVTAILSDYHISIYFKGWTKGHLGIGSYLSLRAKTATSCYYLGEREQDKVEKVSMQLEFNFNA